MAKTFVLAPDSFKESMTAIQACQAMQRGILRVFPDANCIQVPMADGGEGTLDAILASCSGQRILKTVTGPLAEQKVAAYFALIDDGRSAVIEMAVANGMACLAADQRNPMLSSSFGTGELIAAALDCGVEKIIVAVGGSVTNDGGMGMAQALGVRFLDAQGKSLGLGAQFLSRVVDIDLTQLDPRLKNIELVIASDVKNPLCGINGASHIFGPQKGANADMVIALDAGLAHFSELIKQQLNLDFAQVSGAGAAGGLAYGLMVFTQAQMQAGVGLVLEYTQLAQAIAQADYVFTAEGALDAQTLMGKTPYGVAQVAKALNKPVIACAGMLGDGVEQLYDHGFDAVFSILERCSSVEQACLNGEKNLEACCENIARLLRLKAH